MRVITAQYDRVVRAEVAFTLYRDDNGIWFVIKTPELSREIRCEFDRLTANELADILHDMASLV